MTPAPPAGVVPIWKGSPNFTSHGLTDVVALVIHTTAGGYEAALSWFANSASKVSAHFVAALDGRLAQCVALSDAAYANGILQDGNRWAPVFGTAWVNGRTISCETEDLGSPNQPVTDAQYAAVLSAGRLALKSHPTIKTLCGHKDISPIDRPNCPGARWYASGRMDVLARDLGLTLL